MEHIPMKLAIRRYWAMRRHQKAHSESSASGWNQVVTIRADEREPGVVVIAIRESEQRPWTQTAIGTADIQPIVRELQNARETATRALHKTYGA